MYTGLKVIKKYKLKFKLKGKYKKIIYPIKLNMKLKFKKRFLLLYYNNYNLISNNITIIYCDKKPKNDYFNHPEKNTDIKISIKNISNKLHKKDYWLTSGHWGKLLSHTFYWYSLVNLYLQNKDDKEFKDFSVSELQFILKYINSEEWKAPFLDKNTDICTMNYLQLT